jgi:hypothetical protein
MRTKAEILDAKLEFLTNELAKVQREIYGLQHTECNLHCAGCGENLSTEWDFAKHFVIPDEQFLNLGECPNRSTRAPRGVVSIAYEITRRIV